MWSWSGPETSVLHKSYTKQDSIMLIIVFIIHLCDWTACWSRGMILALGARGSKFKSRTGPLLFQAWPFICCTPPDLIPTPCLSKFLKSRNSFWWKSCLFQKCRGFSKKMHRIRALDALIVCYFVCFCIKFRKSVIKYLNFTLFIKISKLIHPPIYSAPPPSVY